MTTYYNEIEPYAAEWLRRLAADGRISSGHVDDRSIEHVTAQDLAGYQRAHFFAGIAGWEHALDLAGVPADLPVWTGSCPCQPFSAAGRRKGTADTRHLWPVWVKLIEQCRPPVIFGEQVASPLGRKWLDAVRADLEALGYAVAATDLCAAGAGAPHIRQRLWFGAVRMADSKHPKWWKRATKRHSDSRQHGDQQGPKSSVDDASHCRVGRLADTSEGQLPVKKREPQGRDGARPTGANAATGRPSAVHGGWQAADWLFCRDGKWRPVEPGTFPLVDGLPTRMGQLRAYGNAIVPQAAAAFIEAFLGGVADSLGSDR